MKIRACGKQLVWLGDLEAVSNATRCDCESRVGAMEGYESPFRAE